MIVFKICLLLLPCLALVGGGAPAPLSHTPKEIVVNNRVLALVAGKSITVCDVMKTMDVFLHRYNPQAMSSLISRFQFYMANWHKVLNEMVDQELMLKDAERMHLKVSDGDVREEILKRYGPNIMRALDALGLTYEEAKKSVHDEMLVQRVLWFRVHAKSLASVGPQSLAQAYQEYCNAHPGTQWIYQVLSVRSASEKIGKALAERLFDILHVGDTPFEQLVQRLKEENPEAHVQLSSEYQVKDRDLSLAHKEVLQSLNIGSFSPPIPQVSRGDNRIVHRIFLLKDRIEHALPSFEDMAEKLYEERLQDVFVKERAQYLAKLRERESFDKNQLFFPESFYPFALR